MLFSCFRKSLKEFFRIVGSVKALIGLGGWFA